MAKKQVSLHVQEDTLPRLHQYKHMIGSITGKNTSVDTTIRDLLDIATSKKYYCVYDGCDPDIIIFGIGRTESEASEMWRKTTILQWVEDLGDWKLQSAQPEVYAHVDMHGGDAVNGHVFRKSNGVISLTDRKEPTLNQLLRILFHVYPISKPITTTIINAYCSPIPPEVKTSLEDAGVTPLGSYRDHIICIDTDTFVAISSKDI